MTVIYLTDRRLEAWRHKHLRACRSFILRNCVIEGGKDG